MNKKNLSIRETLDKKIRNSFVNLSPFLAQKFVKTKYFLGRENMLEEMQERTKNISSPLRRVLAKKQISNIFEGFLCYESNFKDYNKLVRETAWRQQTKKFSSLNPIKDIVSHYLGYLQDTFYRGSRKAAGTFDAELSGLPEELNYLARLN